MSPFKTRIPATHRLLQRIDYYRFDGNLTDQLNRYFLFTPKSQGITEAGWRQLIIETVEEHNLGWVLIPAPGYRL